MRYGIIEIGTRGIRLLVADASPLGIQKIVYSAGDLSHLGESAGPAGKIPAATIKRIKRIVASYLDVAEENGAEEVFAIATEAVRVAPNRGEFEREISQVLPLEILDKDSEAAFSFLASVEAFKDELAAGSTLLVLDQGGGTTELIYGYIGQDGVPAVKATLTLEFGTFALSKMFVDSPSATVAWSRISRQLREGLEAGQYKEKLAELLQRPPTLAVALGSAITFYTRDEIASEEGRKPPLRSLHGRSVNPLEIVDYLGRIQPALDQMQLTPGDFSQDSDEAIVLSGLVIYAAIAQQFGIELYLISRSGMRYGTLAQHAGRQVMIDIDRQSGGGQDDNSGHSPAPA